MSHVLREIVIGLFGRLCNMAYPEPIPVLKSQDAKEFDKKLNNFKLNKSQKEFYRKGKKLFVKEE